MKPYKYQDMGEYLCEYGWETTSKLNGESPLEEKEKENSLVNNKVMYTSKIIKIKGKIQI